VCIVFVGLLCGMVVDIDLHSVAFVRPEPQLTG